MFFEKIISWHNSQLPSKCLCEKRIHFILFLRKWQPYVCASKFFDKSLKFWKFHKKCFLTFFLKKIYCDIIHNRLLSVYVKKELIFDYFWENDGHMSVPQNFLTKVWNFENFIKSVFWLFFWKKLYRDIILNCLLSVYVKK